jgi:hypothetical protein
MTLEEYIATVADFDEYTASEKIDYFAYYLMIVESVDVFSPIQIKKCFEKIHSRPYSNISDYLIRKSSGKGAPFIKSKAGYRLERSRLREIEKELGVAPHVSAASSSLRGHVRQGMSGTAEAFIVEAISCYEHKLYRSAIIMTWLFAMDSIFEYILSKKASEFNAAYQADSSNKKGLQISSKDDFAELKESKLIEICRSANIITNDVRKILDTKLGIRNTCAHPSAVKILDVKCADFITDLLDNVIAKYVV